MIETVEKVEDGIERVVVKPVQRQFETPLVFQHGMWQGAWCWREWQEWFAEWGWETHAYSLPGHGRSPVQRPIRWCTLGYYLDFLTAEIARQPRPPVLIGHSMGGALAQWYLKKVADDLPAAVLVAPWTSHSMLPAVFKAFTWDFWGSTTTLLTLSAAPLVRSPERVKRMFLTEGARISPEEFFDKAGPESMWVLLQYNPLQWRPARHVKTPLLWLAGGDDSMINESWERKSAAHYGAEYVVVPGEGHGLMLERSSRQTAERIRDWLLTLELD